MDTPLVLTHDHDPKVVFRGHFILDANLDPPSYDDLWANFQHISRAYNDLLAHHRDLSDAHHALQDELGSFRDNYWSLRSKQQELVDDAINARIQSWRHVVRVEELEKELRLLRHGEAHTLSTKRKYADIEGGDNDGAGSDWSASTHSRSQSPSNDALNTPASASSKIASAPPLNNEPSEGCTSFGAQLLASSCEEPREYTSEIRTPKRRRETRPGLNYAHPPVDVDPHRQCVIDIQIEKANHRDQTSPETSSKRTPHVRRSTPQTRSGTRSSRRRRPCVKEQNATAAAVAAALSEAAVNHRDPSCSLSLEG